MLKDIQQVYELKRSNPECDISSSMSDAKPKTSRTLEQDLERNWDIFSCMI